MTRELAFPLVEIEGAPRERGVQYGRQAGERLGRGLALYREAFANSGVRWDEALAIAARLWPSLESYDRDMALELSGIAEGAGVAQEEVFILNARTEILFWRSSAAQARNAAPQEECTSIVALPEITRDGVVLHGQNWDWNPACADTAIVLHIKPETGPEILTFVEAGQLARSGMNSAGLALTANGLHASTDSGRLGTPNPFIRRRLLMQTHLATAIGAVLNADISFSHNLAISHRGGEAFQLEATPDETFWLAPESGLLVHANHFKSDAARAKIKDFGLTRCPESLYRDRRAHAIVAASAGNVTEDTLKQAFSDRYGAPHAILRTPTRRLGGNLSGTVATILMNTFHGRLWLANSPYLGEPAFSEYAIDITGA